MCAEKTTYLPSLGKFRVVFKVYIATSNNFIISHSITHSKSIKEMKDIMKNIIVYLKHI